MSPTDLITEYRSKGALIDTNLLVLLIVGTYKRTRILTFKRTRQYSPEDYDLVAHLIKLFNRWITTPNILTEADNLLRQLPEEEHPPVAYIMRSLVEDFFEIYQPSIETTHQKEFSRLGLADCTTIAVANDALVLTDDFRLSNYLSKLGRASININHLRTL